MKLHDVYDLIAWGLRPTCAELDVYGGVQSPREGVALTVRLSDTIDVQW